jgi:hypothetical protein
MYYDALIAKWPSMQGADTAAKLAALNAETVPGPDRKVPVVELMDYLRTNGVWPKIKLSGDLYASSNGAQGSIGAWAAVDYNNDTRMGTLDVSLPVTGLLLADLVTSGLLTQAQSDAIVAMKNTSTPWWQANGYSSPISAGDLAAAGGLS